MNNKVTKRVLIWLFFGMILTAVPITAAAVMGLPKNASIVNFLNSCSTRTSWPWLSPSPPPPRRTSSSQEKARMVDY